MTHVFTLMNAYGPPAGVQIGTIEFVGSRGATRTFPLMAGQKIRDFYHGQFANTLNNGIPGVYALNAFHCVDPTNCLGSAGTKDVYTGSLGTYVVDEQEFILGAELASRWCGSSSRTRTTMALCRFCWASPRDRGSAPRLARFPYIGTGAR